MKDRVLLFLNQELRHTDDGWMHLVARGEFPNVDALTGKPVIQVVDDIAIDTMRQRFQAEAAAENFAGMLVDFEHWSYDPDKSSEAAAWVHELREEPDGLWARRELSDLGGSALKNKRYKHVSPTFDTGVVIGHEADGTPRVRPLHIHRAGFTNAHNMKTLRPMVNREEFPEGNEALGGNPKPEQKENPMLEKILAALGVAADATEEVVLDAIKALKDAVPNPEEQAELVNREQVTQLIADLKQFAPIISDQEAIIPSLLHNREATVAMLGGIAMPKGEKPKPVILPNREDLKNPKPLDEAGEADRMKKQQAEVESYRLQNRCTHEQAHNAIRRAQPELFGLTS